MLDALKEFETLLVKQAFVGAIRQGVQAVRSAATNPALRAGMVGAGQKAAQFGRQQVMPRLQKAGRGYQEMGQAALGRGQFAGQPLRSRVGSLGSDARYAAGATGVGAAGYAAGRAMDSPTRFEVQNGRLVKVGNMLSSGPAMTGGMGAMSPISSGLGGGSAPNTPKGGLSRTPGLTNTAQPSPGLTSTPKVTTGMNAGVAK